MIENVKKKDGANTYDMKAVGSVAVTSHRCYRYFYGNRTGENKILFAKQRFVGR